MFVRRINLLCVLIPFLLSLQIVAQTVDVKSPLSPEDSLRHFQLDPLLSIELVAAEPEVVDPVALRFDEDGRMWVAEMRDYPLGPIKKMDGQRTEKDAEPLSQIKILEDKDGDGRFETATVFADKLLFVTGLQPWKGGVIVTLSGKVAYMKDTSGDGKADVNETWFTGFSESNSQLRANHPTFALDNHIYIANGLRGGMVVNHLRKIRSQESEKKEDAPINISGMDFRFDPLTGEAEAVSGNGQFGLCFDDWGNRFVCSNRNPCQHVVIENRYLKKAPTVAIPTVVLDVAPFAENSRIYPISKFWTTSNLHEGQFTAACGVFIYRGDLLPREFHGNVFTCDPTGNLIHREIMEPKGVTFTSKPAYEGKEFLASPDTWFRPVSMELGPDGALYVVDMYRAVIEHPEWVPDELKNRPDERLGDDRGRIYRIVPKGRKERGKTPLRISQMKTEELTALLASNNAWQRETAQRLVVEGRNLTVAEQISQQVFIRLSNHFDDSKSPHERLHILWTLAGKRLLKPHWINAATDRDPRVGRNVLIALESQIVPNAETNSLLQLMYELEKSPLQCFQLSLSMRASGIPVDAGLPIVVPLQRTILADDPWTRRATLILADSNMAECLHELIGLLNLRKKPLSQAQELLLMEWGMHLGTVGTDANAIEILTQLTTADDRPARERIQMVVLDALGKGLIRRRASLELVITRSKDDELKGRLTSLLTRFMAVANDETAEIADRLSAVQSLAHFSGSDAVLLPIAIKNQSQELRQTAIAVLAGRDSINGWPQLLQQSSGEPSAIRQAILEGVLHRSERIVILLEALESGSIKATELDPVQTGRLLKHGDAKIRERAEKIFGSATPEDRKKALEDYQGVLTMTGDAKRGQVSFAKNCSTCHKIGETGVNVAPDISDSRTKTHAQILADIIQPNRAIDANYVAYNLLLTDGTTAAGILTSETSTSITLKAAGAKVITVARGEIEELKSTGISLMPDGLEKTIPLQEMADVISFIKNWRYLDGRVPVNSSPLTP